MPVDAAAATPRPDIEFAADAHMDSMRFGSDPAAHVRFSGGAGRIRATMQSETACRSGCATYRDATVRTTISAPLRDPARAAATPPPPEDAP